MMFVYICLGVLMMYFMPGFIVLAGINKFSKVKSGFNFFDGILVIFITSLLINYFAVYTLCRLHIYNHNAVVFLSIIELLLSLFLIKDYSLLVLKLPELKNLEIKQFFFFLLAFFLYFWGISFEEPKIFSSWDAVASWNRWALVFFDNSLPSDTYHYPQALPAQWSIFYQLCRDPLEFLPKATVPLYLYLSVLMLLERKSYIAGFLFLLFFYKTGSVHTGYVDIPVACISFSSLLLLENACDKKNTAILFAGALAACAASLVKQAGLFVVLCYPVLALIFFQFSSRRQKIRFFVLYFVLVLFTAGFTYAYLQRNIMLGRSASEISVVTNEIYKGTPFYCRIIPAFMKLFKGHRLMLLIGIPFVCLNEKKIVRVIGLIGLAYLTAWAAFFSYDLRNGYLAWPLIVYSECRGLEYIVEKIRRHNKIVLPKTNLQFGMLGLMLIAFLTGVAVTPPQWLLLYRQEKEKMLRGGDAAIYIENFYRISKETSPYFCNYTPLGWVSKNSFVYKNYIPVWFDNAQTIRTDLERIRNENIKYICLGPGTSQEFNDYVNEKIQENVFAVLYDDGGIRFIKVEDADSL